MKKYMLPVVFCALALSSSAQTTSTQETTSNTKLDRTLRAVQRQQEAYSLSHRTTRAGAALTTADSLAAPTINYNGARQSILAPLSLIITTQPNTSAQVTEMLTQAGQHATTISNTVVTARVAPEWLTTLSNDTRIVRLTASKRLRPFLQKARQVTGVDRVHAGDNLDTPFTGKGIVIGVIDQSFEFKHMGFLDENGKSRIKMLWDRSKDIEKDIQSKAAPILDVDVSKQTHDTYDSGSGHGTHVTNIAAGSKHADNPFYGVAPKADIVVIPSSFENTEIIEDIRSVKAYASREHKPWVVNLSLGSVIGPHDGSTDYDQAIDRMAQDKGGIVVGAMGNEGDQYFHAFSSFQPGETKQVFIHYEKDQDGNATEDDLTHIDFWGISEVNAEQFTVTPILAVKSSNAEQLKVKKYGADFWKKYLDDGKVWSEISPKNNRENHFVGVKMNKLLEDLGSRYKKIIFGVEITAKSTNTADATLHGWIYSEEPNYARFVLAKTDSKFESIKPDNLYIVGEGGASIPSAIAVGSFTTTVLDTLEREGAHSTFSSNGPWLNPNYPKPAVLAPGASIMSALNKYAPGFDKNNAAYSNRFNNKVYHYGYMEGTSMATPFVAGSIALWLEANPQLSYTDVLDIIKETSTKHADMEGEAWTPTYGYGLINVYEGLKLALKKAGKDPLTAIERVSGSAAPVTFHTIATQWQILFNNPERTATLEVMSLDGRSLYRQQLSSIAQGDEVNIPTDRFTPGVYVLQVSTSGAKIAQKMVRQ
ncbi:MAG: S8 family peptidase [Alloprevotella sp.]|nr:S8 family peptidase [Alloprevotella sp.]